MQPEPSVTATPPESNEAAPLTRGESRFREAIAKRRTFAIISHPDAGKTTLTEKLLLYSGAVQEAGSVRAHKNQRAVTSDWMAMERERGISITSTVLQMEFAGTNINLLDTPGHEDFSEDTYRTLTAADCAVMVLDAAKGIEAQTHKLFKVCAMRKIPIITFINKMDRPGRDPLSLLSEIEQVLGIDAVPLNWPVGEAYSFQGVYDRMKEQTLIFTPSAHGSTRVPTQVLTSEETRATLGEEITGPLFTALELLNGAGVAFDRTRFLQAKLTPVFFGSALTNFGIEQFLSSFLELAPAPTPRMSDIGPIPPDMPHFAGMIFKIQANMDPRHRDRIAFMRVNSGRFLRGMTVTHTRTGKKLRLAQSHRLFADSRDSIEEAYPGDIVGLVSPGDLRLGDTLCEGQPFNFQGMPEFSPEFFAIINCEQTLKRKQFEKGLQQLVEEGAIQILLNPHSLRKEPILAAVGQLQFEVVQYRLLSEYGAKTSCRRLPFKIAFWAEGPAINEEDFPSDAMMTLDSRGNRVLLFTSQWDADYFKRQNPTITLKTSSL